MNPAAIPSRDAHALTPSRTLPAQLFDLCQQKAFPHVGQGSTPDGTKVPDQRQLEDELDDAIEEQRVQAALAEDARDMARAFDHTRRMVRLILSRSVQHQERREREHLAMVERSLDEGCCYFAHEGDLARRQAERSRT